MTTETIPSAKTLEALGTEYLAEMLVQICTGDAELERRLVVLATTAAPRLAAREIRRRLDFIGRSRTYIYSDRRDAFIAEIDNQRRAIRELARHDPGEALDLLWELTALADSVSLRCDNSDDTVLDAFRASAATGSRPARCWRCRNAATLRSRSPKPRRRWRAPGASAPTCSRADGLKRST
jgi:hypothetical protein